MSCSWSRRPPVVSERWAMYDLPIDDDRVPILNDPLRSQGTNAGRSVRKAAN